MTETELRRQAGNKTRKRREKKHARGLVEAEHKVGAQGVDSESAVVRRPLRPGVGPETRGGRRCAHS